MNLIESFFNTTDHMKTEHPVIDAGDVYKMELELAGFGKEDVKIKVLDDILYVNRSGRISKVPIARSELELDEIPLSPTKSSEVFQKRQAASAIEASKINNKIIFI